MTQDNSEVSIFMDQSDIERALMRIAHQILEKNKGVKDLALVGLVTRGECLAKRLGDLIEEIEGTRPPIGRLDISFYRDDYASHFVPKMVTTDIMFNIDGLNIVLVDDVLFTGRTIRAALNALADLGRPETIQLAVLLDRGYRQLPIRADYVGKNVRSTLDDSVRLFLDEMDGRTQVEIMPRGADKRTNTTSAGKWTFQSSDDSTESKNDTADKPLSQGVSQ